MSRKPYVYTRSEANWPHRAHLRLDVPANLEESTAAGAAAEAWRKQHRAGYFHVYTFPDIELGEPGQFTLLLPVDIAETVIEELMERVAEAIPAHAVSLKYVPARVFSTLLAVEKTAASVTLRLRSPDREVYTLAFGIGEETIYPHRLVSWGLPRDTRDVLSVIYKERGDANSYGLEVWLEDEHEVLAKIKE